MKLTQKILLIVVPLIVAPLLVLGWMAHSQLERAHSERMLMELEIRVAQASRSISAIIHNAQSNAVLLSNADVVQAYLLEDIEKDRRATMRPALLDRFIETLQHHPDYEEIRVILPDGREDARLARSSIENRTEVESGSPLFDALGALDGDKALVKVLNNPDTGEASLYVAQAVHQADHDDNPSLAVRRLRGYLVVTVSLEPIRRTVAQTQIGTSGFLVVADSRGRALLAAEQSAAAAASAADVAVSLDSGQIARVGGLADDYVWLKTANEGHGLYVVGALPDSDLRAAGDRLAFQIAMVIAGAVAVTALLMFGMLRRLVITPIRRLGDTVSEFRRGNLAAAATLDSSDELGALSRDFNQMGADLKASHEALRLAKNAAEHASAAKSQFLANMSHEIRTPMNGVLGIASLLTRTELSEVQRRYVSTIVNSGQTLLTVISDILDFSKIEAGHLTVERIPFDLPEALDEVISLFSETAAETSVHLFLDAEPDIPRTVRGDPSRVRQVLSNLISNAIKFTPAEGSVTLQVFATPRTDDRVTVTFAVVDTGIGIAPEKLDTVFEAFEQADGSTSRRFGGTGLGLAIVQELVRLMDGTVTAKSVVGAGSTFTVSLPFKPLAVTVPSGRNAAASSTANDLHFDARVLLAEDNIVNQEVARECLVGAGCAVTVVDNGRDAVEAWRDGAFDVILMDCQMPEMDGFEATAEIRAEESRAESRGHTPIIAVTANALDEDRKRCLAGGMDDYLSKPFDRAALVATLARWVHAQARASRNRSLTISR